MTTDVAVRPRPCPRPAPPISLESAIAGYVRVSHVAFPAGYNTQEERQAYVDQLRELRRAELVSDASRRGDVITLWFDDMGISGQGRFLPKRLDFAWMRRDALSGRIRAIYARDLSRLFRDLVQQEAWFAEIEGAGVAVNTNDLPFTMDAHTRVLLRQKLGSIYQWIARRNGDIIAAAKEELVTAGLRVAFCADCFGLLYDHELHRFSVDEATADKVRWVYEVFNECQGVAGRAAREMNSRFQAGDPRATLSPRGKSWGQGMVSEFVRSPIYRRVVSYNDLWLPSPDLIPEIVPPGVIAETDRLIQERQPYCDNIAETKRACRHGYTYSHLLICGQCGRPMGPMRAKMLLDPAVLRAFSWRCDPTRPPISLSRSGSPLYAAGQFPNETDVDAESPVGSPIRACDRSLVPGISVHMGENRRVNQYRLDTLVGRALREAVVRYRQRQEFAASAIHLGDKSKKSDWAARHEEALAVQKRRLLDLYISGTVSDIAELEPRLRRIEDERAFLRAHNGAHCLSNHPKPSTQIEPSHLPNPSILSAHNRSDADDQMFSELGAIGVSGQNAPSVRSGSQMGVEMPAWQVIEDQILALWPEPPAPMDEQERETLNRAANVPLNEDKRALLLSLEARIWVRVSPREPYVYRRGKVHRRYENIVSIVLELPRLGFSGDKALAQTETSEDLDRVVSNR